MDWIWIEATKAGVQEAARTAEFASAMSRVPVLAGLGTPFKSSDPVQLTEEETEYSIQAVKHMFPSHLLLQFDCTNTVPEQVLRNVSVVVDLAEAVRCARCKSAVGIFYCHASIQLQPT